MELRPNWQTESRSASQEIPRDVYLRIWDEYLKSEV
jgi:hypothetical protein